MHARLDPPPRSQRPSPPSRPGSTEVHIPRHGPPSSVTHLLNCCVHPHRFTALGPAAEEPRRSRHHPTAASRTREDVRELVPAEVALERQSRVPSFRVARGEEPEGIPADVLAWWRIAAAEP